MAAGACRRRLPPARARNAAPVHRVKEWEERAAAPARVSPFPVCVLTRGVVLGTRVCTYSTRTASSVQYRACLKSPSRTTPALRATRKGMGKGCGPPYRAAPQHPPSLRTRPTRRGRPTCGRRSHRSHANRLASILAWTRPAGGGGGEEAQPAANSLPSPCDDQRAHREKEQPTRGGVKDGRGWQSVAVVCTHCSQPAPPLSPHCAEPPSAPYHPQGDRPCARAVVTHANTRTPGLLPPSQRYTR